MSTTILEATVTRWKEVRAENERDKELITPEQLKSWEDFEAKTTARIRSIVEGYDGSNLSDTDRDWLRSLNTSIDRAERVSRDDLLEKKKARDEAERKRLEEEELKRQAEERRKLEVEETKGRLLSMLDI